MATATGVRTRQLSKPLGRRLAILVGVLCLVAAACSDTTPLEAGTDISAGDTTTTTLASDPEPGESGESDGAGAGDSDIVVCSNTALPINALNDLEPLTSRPEIEAAVNVFLESGEGNFWAQEGWQVVTISDTEVYVIVLQTEAQIKQDAEDRDVEVFFDDGFGDGIDDTINFSAHNVEFADGQWRWAGSVSGEDCELETVVPEGLNRVEWELDPSAPLDATSATINLLATERECASGQAMGDRLLPPTVVETDDAVLISMLATPPPGDAFTCQGNPSQPVSIELSAPLGDREVVDGTTTAGRLSDYVGDVFGLNE